jgi:hypothetical protein
MHETHYYYFKIEIEIYSLDLKIVPHSWVSTLIWSVVWFTWTLRLRVGITHQDMSCNFPLI